MYGITLVMIVYPLWLFVFPLVVAVFFGMTSQMGRRYPLWFSGIALVWLLVCFPLLMWIIAVEGIPWPNTSMLQLPFGAIGFWAFLYLTPLLWVLAEKRFKLNESNSNA